MRRFIPILAVLAIGLWNTAVADEIPGSASRGKVLYERFCMSCHGVRGDGRGETAQWLSIKPRDFQQGVFEWRSTPPGSLPLISDLDQTISQGIYNTSMPPWYAIGHKARLDLIAYIQTFSSRWKTEQPQAPIVIPPEPPYTQESVARGREVFEQNECAKCHGEGGRGDGPASMTLRDDWGYPIVPYDLTSGHLRGGDTSKDIYRVFMTGLSGTPMPSFARAIDPDQAWDLVHYIESLRGKSEEVTRR
jgi:mono/diheme cytochrome c family protein